MASSFSQPARTLVWLALLSVVLLILYLLLPQSGPNRNEPDDEASALEYGTPAGAPGELDSTRSSPSKVVRIMVQHQEPAVDGAAHNIGAPKQVGDYLHVGPLDRDSRDSMIANSLSLLASLEAELASTIGNDEVRESGLLRKILLRHSMLKALQDGSYITTRRAQSTPPLSIPGAEVVRSGGQVGGEYVNVTFVFPLATHPDLEMARHRRQLAQYYADWTKANEFNAMPEGTRQALAAEISAILRKRDISSDELKYVWHSIGRGTRLDFESGTVTVEPLR